MTADTAQSRTGASANGMEYLTFGAGPRSMLSIPGGPGSSIPHGWMERLFLRSYRPYLAAGFTVWTVTRRRGMPQGHTMADMANDYADFIADELGGRADLVVGTSMGGMIAQCLAALHPATLTHVALVASAYRVCDWARDVDARIAEALERGDEVAAGRAFAEYLLPAPRQAWARRVVGPAMRRSLLTGYDTAARDVLVEARAEMSFDSRPVLPLIQAPVLLASGDVDRFFPQDLVAQTAASIPDCTLVWYQGQGHFKVSSSSRVRHDVLAFVDG